MKEYEDQLVVQSVNGIVVASIRGLPTPELLAACQAEVRRLVNETGSALVLYDATAMQAPSVDVAWSQRTVDAHLPLHAKRAILVVDTRVAYLARLAFADEFGGAKVIYNDRSKALAWLRATE